MSIVEALVGFALTALFVPQLAGCAVTPRWALLAVTLALLVRLPQKITLAHLTLALFIIWSTISLLWTPNVLDGLNEICEYIIAAQAFLLGVQIKNLGPIFRGLGVGLVLSTIMLAAQQWIDPDLVLHGTTHAGLFYNSATLGEIACLVAIALIVQHDWLLLVAIAPCVLVPEARAGWIAFTAAGIVWLWQRSWFLAIDLALLCVAAFALSLYGGFHVDSVWQRADIWRDAAHGLTWLGHGVGSTWTDFAALSTTLDIATERPDHLHNDYLEMIFEGGAVAGFLAICLGWCVFRAPAGAGKIIFAGFAAEMLVAFPLHLPCQAFIGALCLGHVARDLTDIRELLSRWGISLFGGHADRTNGPGASGVASIG